MSTKDYRRQIEQEIAQARARAEEVRWGHAVEAAGGEEALGAAAGDASDDDRLSAALADRRHSSELRAAVLAALVQRSGGAPRGHELPLRHLADADEDAAVRLSALLLLKQAMFHSPTTEDWRPVLIDALRAATHASDELLRLAAFDLLAAMKDRKAQEELIEGLHDPGSARVPAAHALRFLAHDVHAGVFDAARRHADASDDEDVQVAALRVLAGDAGSTERFRGLALDGAESLRVRKLAASALMSLAPALLRKVHAALDRDAEDAPDVALEATDAAGAGPDRSHEHDHVREHVRSLLGLGE